MGISFQVAAEAHVVAEDEDVVEVPIEGVVYQARRPSTAQAALMIGATRDLSTTFDVIEALMGETARMHIERLVWARRIDLDDLVGDGSDQNPDGGLIRQIFEEFNKGRPTQPSTASASSQTSGGRKSTGRSPGRGSTRSTSPSTDS